MSRRTSGKLNRPLSDDAVVRLCRLLHDTDLSFTTLAVRFDCSPNAVANINHRFKIRPKQRNGVNWRHVHA